MTLFGNRDYADANKSRILRQNYSGFRLRPKTKDNIFIIERKGRLNMWTHREDRGKDQSDASTAQGISRVPGSHQKAEIGTEQILLQNSCEA